MRYGRVIALYAMKLRGCRQLFLRLLVGQVVEDGTEPKYLEDWSENNTQAIIPLTSVVDHFGYIAKDGRLFIVEKEDDEDAQLG